MSNQTMLGEDDLAFEQRLLGAGLAEPLPHERTEIALLRFAAGLAALQSGTVGTASLGGPAGSTVLGPRQRLAAAGKWLLLGVVAGGLATFVWLRPMAQPASHAPVASLAAPAAAPPTPRSAPPTPAPASEPPPATATVEAAPRRPNSRVASVGRALKSRSDLAAEVAALDGIRTAISIGALRDAELKLADYRTRFATPSLGSEAEVLALEVLVAQGRARAAASAAERFIRQHPRDPQVARVRALVE